MVHLSSFSIYIGKKEKRRMMQISAKKNRFPQF